MIPSSSGESCFQNMLIRFLYSVVLSYRVCSKNIVQDHCIAKKEIEFITATTANILFKEVALTLNTYNTSVDYKQKLQKC